MFYYLLLYVKSHEELAGPIIALLHPSNIAAFEEMLQQ